MDSRGFWIQRWLEGGEFCKPVEGALYLFPQRLIWQWIDENIEKRAWSVASFVPNALFHEEGKPCLPRELLKRYGDREEVRRHFSANYSSESWTGPLSLHYKNKRQKLLEFKELENDSNVLLWIDEYISYLGSQIEQAEIGEEREDF